MPLTPLPATPSASGRMSQVRAVLLAPVPFGAVALVRWARAAGGQQRARENCAAAVVQDQNRKRERDAVAAAAVTSSEPAERNTAGNVVLPPGAQSWG